MAKTNVYHDSDSGYLGSAGVHAESWRVHGNEAQMIDASGYGALSPAEDDNGVNTCVKGPPNAPGFGKAPTCKSGSPSGASDGAAASRRSVERLAEHKRNAGSDIEDPDGIGRRIT